MRLHSILSRPTFTSFIVLLLGVGCNTPRRPAASFVPEKLLEMDAAVEQAVAEKKCPGGVLWVETRGSSYHKAYGRRAVAPQDEPMTKDTIFDAASLTKVVATTPSIMLLIERGSLNLDDAVSQWIPEFAALGKDSVTIRHLLTHTSGLRPGIETKSGWRGQAAAVEKACAERLVAQPGEVFRYSDINFIVLGEIVQRASKMPLETFARRNIYDPLRMQDTGFLPAADLIPRIAPTEVVDEKPFRGVVHDPTSRLMGGVAGHAGLFTTAEDLARYARMLLNGGKLDGARVFRPETVSMMTAVHTTLTNGIKRGLGWDIDSPYSGPRGKLFPVGSYGHTGWTGTSLWIDPFSRSFVIFLSNRNHPDERGSVIPLRRRLGTLAAEAITGFDFAYVPGALTSSQRAVQTSGSPTNGVGSQVLNGIDVLVRNKFAPLRGLRVALITNHTGEGRNRNATIDLLKNAPGVRLVTLFSPEHGIRGTLDEKVGDQTDERTGLPIYSLYGEKRKPQPAQLQGVDALVYDIQDIGCRFYTYTATMAMCMEAAAENGKKFFVLDRVNPINGTSVDGPVLNSKPTFVGYHYVPLRYGMTIGELARMFNAERGCNADLTVIPVENWTRASWLDETGLPWTNPSPNMRNLTQAILYPGVGLVESAVSVGRGTDTPFEVVGAPYVDDVNFAASLNSAKLPGVAFVPIRFTPTASIHKGQHCGGVYILLVDREKCNVVDVGLLIAKTLHRMYPKQFDVAKIRHLLLDEATLSAVVVDKPLAEIRALWQPKVEEFVEIRKKYLLYP